MKKLLRSCLIAGFVLNVVAFAQPEMDTTFGSGGKSIFGNGSLVSVEDIAVQPDSKIVMGAPCWHFELSSFPFCALRVTEGGGLDNTFRSGNPSSTVGGVFTRFTGMGNGAVSGVASQSDGKVIMVGFLTPTNENAAVVRYNSDGTLDSSFGTGGLVLTDISGNDRAEKVAVQPDGKIVVVGFAGSAQFVARYLTDGALDSSFGTGGIVQVVLPEGTTTGRSIAIQHDGKIVVGGSVTGGHLLTRLNSDGSLDSSWDGDGVRIVSVATVGLGLRSLGLSADGHVVALGGNVIYQFNPDGSLDTGFDGDGSRPALNGSNIVPFRLTVTASGKVTVVGTPGSPFCPGSPFPCFSPNYLYLTARYKADGTPDTFYSDDGYLDIDVGAAHYDGARAIALDPLGRTVIAGRSSSCCVQTIWEQPLYSAVRLAAPPLMYVTVSGRVVGPNGSGVSNATVAAQGISTRTSPFGYYTLNNVPTNHSYAFTVRAKDGVVFAKRTILVDDQITDLNFVGEQHDSEKSKQMDRIDVLVKGKL